MASGYAQLWSSTGLTNPILFDQVGGEIADYVYTGCGWNGQGSIGSSLGNNIAVLAGYSLYTANTNSDSWLCQDDVGPPTYRDPIYAISSPISVVPEPSALALFGAGAMGLIAYVWRRRRAKA